MQIPQSTGIIICPPLEDYPEAPQDQSASELTDCPHCDKKMWLSEKKKELLRIQRMMHKPIEIYCYDCAEKTLKKMAEAGHHINFPMVNL